MIRRLLFLNFHWVYKVTHWFRRHFTAAGLLLCGCAMAGGVLGVDTRQTVAYQIFTLGCSLLLIAMLSSVFFRFRFSARRELPHFGTAGETLRYRIILENKTPHAQADLLLEDLLYQRMPTFAEFLQAGEMGKKQRNRFDDYVGYPRWEWMMRQNRGGDIAAKPLLMLPARGKLDVNMDLRPIRRGYIHFSLLQIARPDPFGLFKSLRTLPKRDKLLILPKRYPVPDLHLPGHRRYQRGGVNLAMSVGDAVEFTSLREYRPGDPLRHIHWKSLAKQGKPIVKEFQDEFFVRHALILDTFMPKGRQDRFEEAVSVAASIACNTISQDALLDFMFIGADAYHFTSGRGLAHLGGMLELLACVEACTDKSFESLLPLVSRHAGCLSGCVCVLLAWDEQRRQLLRMLRNMELPLLALVIVDDADSAALADDEGLGDDVKILKMGEIEAGLAVCTSHLS
ncbi:MAG: DUF58 domain-containing protein [Gammaproteobacteria bacterium]|nr:DUF58 domain-containing protein [Gammaproteobacteria bacterium]